MLPSGKQKAHVAFTWKELGLFHSVWTVGATERTVCLVACADINLRNEPWLLISSRGLFPYLSFCSSVLPQPVGLVSVPLLAVRGKRGKMVRGSILACPLWVITAQATALTRSTLQQPSHGQTWSACVP